MTANDSGWQWTRVREQAALEVARDLLPDKAIARECGIAEITLERWKRVGEFQARVIAHRALWREQIADLGLADRENRIRDYNLLRAKLLQVFDERANDPKMADIPGGRTGIVVERIKSVGFGPEAEIVHEYTIDTPAIREFRGLEEQAARDLGQWVDRSAVQHDDAEFAREYAKRLPGVSDEEAERIAQMVTRKRP